jgi:N-acetylmuramoyl-L-alanine amidase CwlA
MERFSFFLISVVSVGFFACQNNVVKFKPINEVGWSAPGISIPANLTESDSGQVKYLITLTADGEVKEIKVLSNTFNHDAETKWRNELMKIRFTKNELELKNLRYVGTYTIERERCNTND